MDVLSCQDRRHDLVKLIVDRVYVEDTKVTAMTLHSNYHLVLNHKTNGPTEFSVDPMFATSGSDGVGSLSGRSCIVWSGSLNRPALIRYLLKNAIDLTVSNPFAV
jgi:hypothetical protein